MDHQGLPELASRVRAHVVRMSGHGGCYIGAAFSIADVVTSLYFEAMDFSADRPADPDRDYLVLSKGHGVPAVYGALAELGVLSEELLATHQQVGSSVFLHPSLKVPGVQVATGSLGHGVNVAVGIAKGIKMDGGANRVFVISGDGELQEGSVWEAAMASAAFRLDNLCLIVDRNQIQANIRTEELLPLEPLRAKWEAFGWAVAEIDGHDFEEGLPRLNTLPLQAGKPSLVIAHTVRGKGVSFLEDRVDKWMANLSQEEQALALQELGVV